MKMYQIRLISYAMFSKICNEKDENDEEEFDAILFTFETIYVMMNRLLTQYF